MNTNDRRRGDTIGSKTRRFLREAWERFCEEASLDPEDGFSDSW